MKRDIPSRIFQKWGQPEPSAFHPVVMEVGALFDETFPMGSVTWMGAAMFGQAKRSARGVR
jgi:hypothetical protein